MCWLLTTTAGSRDQQVRGVVATEVLCRKYPCFVDCQGKGLDWAGTQKTHFRVDSLGSLGRCQGLVLESYYWRAVLGCAVWQMYPENWFAVPVGEGVRAHRLKNSDNLTLQ
jgi:hypothetical protein